MSYDVSLRACRFVDIFDCNYTSNVARVWFHALCVALDEPIYFLPGGTPPDKTRDAFGAFAPLYGIDNSDAGKVCRMASDVILDNPEFYKGLITGDGTWGTVEGAAKFLRELGECWQANPDALLVVSR